MIACSIIIFGINLKNIVIIFNQYRGIHIVTKTSYCFSFFQSYRILFKRHIKF